MKVVFSTRWVLPVVGGGRGGAAVGKPAKRPTPLIHRKDRPSLAHLNSFLLIQLPVEVDGPRESMVKTANTVYQAKITAAVREWWCSTT